MKKVLTSFSFILLFLFSSFNCFAADFTTFQDVSYNSNQANNLISYADNFDDFIYSDYVIFCDANNSYYIFWGDLTKSGSVVSGSSLSSIHYSRGLDNYYTYVYTVQDLNLTINHLVVSNVDQLGSSSLLFNQFSIYHYLLLFLLFDTSFLFVIMITNLRRSNI